MRTSWNGSSLARLAEKSHLLFAFARAKPAGKLAPSFIGRRRPVGRPRRPKSDTANLQWALWESRSFVRLA